MLSCVVFFANLSSYMSRVIGIMREAGVHLSNQNFRIDLDYDPQSLSEEVWLGDEVDGITFGVIFVRELAAINLAYDPTNLVFVMVIGWDQLIIGEKIERIVPKLIDLWSGTLNRKLKPVSMDSITQNMPGISAEGYYTVLFRNGAAG